MVDAVRLKCQNDYEVSEVRLSENALFYCMNGFPTKLALEF